MTDRDKKVVQTAEQAAPDSGAHELFPRAGDGVLQCVHCDLQFESVEASRRRACITFGAW